MLFDTHLNRIQNEKDFYILETLLSDFSNIFFLTLFEK